MENRFITAFEQFIINKAKDIRKTNHLTMKSFAQIVNTSTSFIGNVESSGMSAKYNLKHIHLICVHFKISPKEFFPEKPIMDNHDEQKFE